MEEIRVECLGAHASTWSRKMILVQGGTIYIIETFSFQMNLADSFEENLDYLKKLTNSFNQSVEKLGSENETAILIN